MFILAKEQPLLCFLTNDLLRILQEGSSLLNLMSNLFHTIYLYRYCDMINKWRGFRSLFAIPVLRSCSGRLVHSGAPSLCLCGRTCCCWTRQNAFSPSSVWITTPSRPCGWWNGPAHPHLHLYAPPRENLTTETTPPPAGHHPGI